MRSLIDVPFTKKRNISKNNFILLIILPLRVFADYEHFKLWDMSDGLSNNTVKSITQSHLGFIWLGIFNTINLTDLRLFGFVPQDHLIGKASLVWFSKEKDTGVFDGYHWNRFSEW